MFDHLILTEDLADRMDRRWLENTLSDIEDDYSLSDDLPELELLEE